MNILYVIGEIIIVCISNARIKLFEINWFDIMIANIIYIIDIIVEIILYINLLFLFIIGFFSVSAGLFLKINIVVVIPIVIFINVFIIMILLKNVKPINIILELIRHFVLVLACMPNDGILIMLYIIVNIISSFNIPRSAANRKIIIVFVIVKYIPVKPYSIISSLSLL